MTPESRLVQSFHHARKLIQLADYPVGILTYGLGQIGTRNLESLIAEFERTLRPPPADYTVADLATQLQTFISGKYDAEFPPPAPSLPGGPPAADPRAAAGLNMGVVIGGFSSNVYYPDEWLLTFPDGVKLQVRGAAPDDGFGVRWWGITAPLMRLIAGVDPGIEQWFVKHGIEQSEARAMMMELIGEFRWPIYFPGMPVQDAVDLVVFLANVAIGHSRFVAGPPVCGGPVDVAIITHRGFTWVRRKQTSVKSDSIFF